MNTKPLKESLPDEHLLQVDPRPRPSVDADWRSRPNLYPGRALSADALSSEQRERAGRLALRGQMVSPGVVAGLEVRLEHEADPLTEENVDLFRIAAGTGLAPSGEDLRLPRATRFRVDRIPAYWLEEGEDPTDFDVSVLSRLKVADTHQGLQAAVLVLVPVESTLADPSDPTDPEAYSFEDPRLLDGCVPVLFAWPKSWPLPQRTDDDQLWRSFLAWDVFERERRQGSLKPAPWEQVGVPVALLGFTPPDSADGYAIPLFADRASVVRPGGAPRSRTPLLYGRGTPLLWQARIQQFSEQYSWLRLYRDFPINSLAYLPPVGVLPKDAFDPFHGYPRFFPWSFHFESVPIPLEQLDAIVGSAASLAPLNVGAYEKVRVLVPMPQAVFDPHLLRQETVDPAFDDAIDSGLKRLGEWRRRRTDLRNKDVLLLNALEGKKLNRFSEHDPDEVTERSEYEGGFPLDPDTYGPEEDTYGTQGNTVPALDEALLEWGDTGTWAAPETLNPWAYKVSAAVSSAGQFGLVLYNGDGKTFLRTTFQESWSPWEDIPDVVTEGSSLVDFCAVWSGDNLALVALVSTPSPDSTGGTALLRFSIRIFRHRHDQGWEWKEAGSADASHARSFTAVAWGVGNIDAFVALETTTQTETDSTTTYQVQKFTWMENTFPVDVIQEMNDRQVKHMVALLRPGPGPDTRIEVLFLGSISGQEGDPWFHHLSGYHENGSPTLTRIELLEQNDAQGNSLSACISGPEQIDVLLVGGSLSHGRFDRGWTFQKDPFAVTSVNSFQITSRRDGRAHAVWNQITVAGNANESIQYASFDGTRWSAPRELLQADVQPVFPTFALVLDGTTQIDIFLATVQGLLHIKMLPDKTRAAVEQQGLPGLISQTETVLARMNDFIQSGSSKVQAETQHVRQLMISGHTEASRLVVSPILGATMVPHPLAARSDIESYFTRFLRKTYDPVKDDPVVEADAREALGQATATRRELTSRLVDLVKDFDLDVSGMTVAGVAKLIPNLTPPQVQLYQPTSGPLTKTVVRENVPLSDLVTNTTTLTSVLDRISNEQAAVDQAFATHAPLRWDKSDYFQTAVQHLEDTLVLLRQLERRTAPYESALESYKQVLAQIQGFQAALGQRLGTVEREVTEARQDVTVALALSDEEKVRITALNARRLDIYEKHVPFLVFQRTRTRELTLESPSHLLETGLVKDVLPEVLASTAAAPPELQSYLELVRDAPLRWFSLARQLLRGLDRIELLHRAFEWARVRAVQRVPVQLPVISGRVSARYALGLSKLVTAREDIIAQQRGAFVQFQPALLASATWLELQQTAHAQLSLGDLIDAAHGRPEVGRAAAAELEGISKVATGLYQRFGEALPAVRLTWAEQLSQYDGPVDLHDLSRLPRWGQVQEVDRREMQALVDWLFQRTVRTDADATSLVNDLVRVCLLLASHAPVNELLSGHVSKPALARAGGTLELAVDPARVRVGMHVLLRANGKTVQAVVEDISSSVVRARVLSTTSATVTLPLMTSAYFSDPARGASTLLPLLGVKR